MAASFNRRSFAKRLHSAIRASALTQREVAKRLGAPENRVSEWTTGRGVPKLDQLPRLAMILSVDPTWLLTGRSSPSAEQALVNELVKIAPALESVASKAKRLQKTGPRA